MLLVAATTQNIYGQEEPDSTVAAGADWIDVELKACLDGQNTLPGQTGCLATALDQWEAQIEHTYGNVLEVLEGSDKANLIASQQQWRTYKKLQFQFLETHYNSMEGRGWSQEMLAAEANVIRQRYLELMAVFENL